jgi:hypothetical protein
MIKIEGIFGICDSHLKRREVRSEVRKLHSELHYTRVYPKVSGLVAWSENCKWYSSLPLGAVVVLLRESV